jgi:hypothetical protein
VTERYFKVFARFVITLLFGSIGLYAYWLFWPVHILSGSDWKLRIHPEQSVLRPGGFFVYETTVCKQGPHSAILEKELVDSIILTLPPVVSNVEDGCHARRFIQFLPHGISPGKYHFVLTAVYQINPLRQQEYTFTSDEFEVADDRPGAKTEQQHEDPGSAESRFRKPDLPADR